MQKFYDNCKSANKTSKHFGWSKFTVLKYLNTNKRFILSDEEKKQKNIDRSLAERRKNKKKLVEYKGGKCQICGYDRCIKALDFHHINPIEKEFELTFMNRKWEVLKKEADKCILVCSNCHREIHDGFIDIYGNEK
jgi:5-methylcytosine-specific restriction endonuclease McrA